MKWPWQKADEPDSVALAMQRVPREYYVPPELIHEANVDSALPIGHGQTISQPAVVAYMTQQLELVPSDRVLEIGTGSGYQTAILAELAREVFTIERIPELSETARQRLLGAGYQNIAFRISDGSDGWREAAPFDAIMVTAAAEEIPDALVEQLALHGRLIVPVGPHAGAQDLFLLKKDGRGKITRKQLWPVRFVPLVRDRNE